MTSTSPSLALVGTGYAQSAPPVISLDALILPAAPAASAYAKECPDERPVCIKRAKRAKDKNQTCLRCGTDLAKEALPDEGAFCIDRLKDGTCARVLICGEDGHSCIRPAALRPPAPSPTKTYAALR
jgi:hypothetical protein